MRILVKLIQLSYKIAAVKQERRSFFSHIIRLGKATHGLCGCSVLGTQAFFILSLHHVQAIALIYMVRDGSMYCTHFRQRDEGKGGVNGMLLSFRVTAYKLYLPRVFSSHWPEYCHVDTNSCKVGGKTYPLFQAQMKRRDSITIKGGVNEFWETRGICILCVTLGFSNC